MVIEHKMLSNIILQLTFKRFNGPFQLLDSVDTTHGDDPTLKEGKLLQVYEFTEFDALTVGGLSRLTEGTLQLQAYEFTDFDDAAVDVLSSKAFQFDRGTEGGC